MNLLRPRSSIPAAAGSNAAFREGRQPASAAAKLIIDEAMRDDGRPLFYAAGASLTDLAIALATAPQIGKRMTLVWIGGSEYPYLAAPRPGPPESEFNLGMDIAAAQAVFGGSDIDIWQVPRSTYRKMLFSRAEMKRRLRAAGTLGRYLEEQLAAMDIMASRFQSEGFGESLILGDSPW